MKQTKIWVYYQKVNVVTNDITDRLPDFLTTSCRY